MTPSWPLGLQALVVVDRARFVDGPAAAGWISREMGLLDAAGYDRLLGALKAFGLPLSAPRRLDVDAVAALTVGDKKSRGGKRRWVLLNGLGRTVVRDDVPDELVRGAIEGVWDAQRG